MLSHEVQGWYVAMVIEAWDSHAAGEVGRLAN